MDALTMDRPPFNNRKNADASWSTGEIAGWLANTRANPDAFPWRLQWIEDAEAVLVARAAAGVQQ